MTSLAWLLGRSGTVYPGHQAWPGRRWPECSTGWGDPPGWARGLPEGRCRNGLEKVCGSLTPASNSGSSRTQAGHHSIASDKGLRAQLLAPLFSRDGDPGAGVWGCPLPTVDRKLLPPPVESKVLLTLSACGSCLRFLTWSEQPDRPTDRATHNQLPRQGDFYAGRASSGIAPHRPQLVCGGLESVLMSSRCDFDC